VSKLTDNLEALLAQGNETALLRFSLGNAYLDDDPVMAVAHLQRAVTIDPAYSAAWKILGKSLVRCDRLEEAREAYRVGIETAERRGDIQAAKEMRVFLKRLDKEHG
jgi:Tfp pilus assembly protein PilF